MAKDVFIHEKALVESDRIGPRTRIWAFVHILRGAVIGESCNIGDHCYIESKVKIGNNVTIKNGISLWDGVTIEDKVFLGPNAVFTNDRYPRAAYKKTPGQLIGTAIKKGATIGANAVVVAGVTIGEYAFVGAGSVVTKDVPNYALVYGNPAEVKGYICQCGAKIDFKKACACGRKYKFDSKLEVVLEE